MNINDYILEQKELRDRLLRLLDIFTDSTDFVITPCEVNDRHGTGIYLKRILLNADKKVIVRSRNLYQGKNDFDDFHLYHHISHDNLCRDTAAAKVKATIGRVEPRNILAIPYFVDDVINALALKDLFDKPLCTYILDDQNVYTQGIPDDLLQELIQRSDICLGVSRELCDVYERKFERAFWWLPPVVSPELIQEQFIEIENLNKEGVLIGNIWSQSWLDRLRNVTRQTGYKINWCGKPERSWLLFDDRELCQDGIIFRDYLPQDELLSLLRHSPYAVILTGTTGEAQDRPELAKLSLPSRVPFIISSSNTPLIVMGNRDTAAARFVESFDLGYVCDYEPESFREAVDKIRSPEMQRQFRRKAASMAKLMSSEGIQDWIWRSLQLKKPADFRFEKLRGSIENANVVITTNEVTQKHGTGALVKRIVRETPDIFSIREVNDYGGEHDLGEVSVLLPIKGLSRLEAFNKTLEALKKSTVQRVFCVPYYPEDLIKAIAITELFNVPLGTYIMDDQNIQAGGISDELMKEFLSKCSLRLATHPELRDAYEQKYGYKFWLLPAVVPDYLIQCSEAGTSPELLSSPETRAANHNGALIGSIWSQRWLEMLGNTVLNAGVALDWFGNSSYHWLQNPKETLSRYGITVWGLLPEEELVKRLKTYAYVVVPTGTLDSRDDQPQLSRLSLPGRIIMAMAASNTPVIIMGSEKTSAASFVKRFGIGLTCDYDADHFRKAVEYITRPEVQKEMRENAARVAREFSAKGIDDWLWQSIDGGQPVDLRFEKLFPRSPGEVIAFIEPPVPDDIYREYIPVYKVARRLSARGFNPDFVVDVGASNGIWSHTASRIFNRARFILIDPLISKYEQAGQDYYLRRIPRVELVELAVSDRAGRTSFQVSPDLYGSSLLNPADFRNYETIEVEVSTLNDIAREKNITGRGILKLDVQCAEHIVLEGASDFLDRVDAIVAELSLVRYDSQARVLLEMLEFMDKLGFRYYDETGEWRSPVDGTLLQKEILFIRKEILIPEISRKI